MFPKHKKVVEYPFVTYVIFNANVFVLGIQHYYLQDYDKVIFECIFWYNTNGLTMRRHYWNHKKTEKDSLKIYIIFIT
jgi:hypothetical protein